MRGSLTGAIVAMLLSSRKKLPLTYTDVNSGGAIQTTAKPPSDVERVRPKADPPAGSGAALKRIGANAVAPAP